MAFRRFGIVRQRLRTKLSWLWPIVSVIGFIGLYAIAVRLYPGGTRSNPQRVGFSISDNYWCDLLDATTYGGRHNAARPVAVAAMAVLCAGLAVLWWSVPVLFPQSPRRGVVVRLAGIASGVIIPWVATRMHDVAIDVAGSLGTVGFVAIATALGSRGGLALNLVMWSALAAAMSNFVIWQTGSGLEVLPLVQKVAFTLFLAWMVLLALRLRREGLARQDGRARPRHEGPRASRYLPGTASFQSPFGTTSGSAVPSNRSACSV